MYFYNLYRNYFKHQATAHPELAHSDAVGSRVFAEIKLEDSFGDFRTAAKAKGYIFRLMDYDYQVGRFDHEITKRISGGFVVAHFFQRDKLSDYLSAKNKAETVMDQVIEKMIADSENGHPLFHGSFDANQDITVQPVEYTGDASYVGYRCVFRLSQYWANCTTPIDSVGWTDGGITPETFE